MRLFRKNKPQKSIRSNALAIRINQTVERQQQRVAGYLARKTQYWNRKSKIIALIVFCLLFGGCSLILFIKAIIHF